ncbi:transcriptional regulator [Scandinavium sp. H11S7]|uniref:Transcriptional regulator n=1 Tax=Scandinavium hiltneri TaxID=2926519 RepID=A0ABT2E135_9ENTR|nr:transcriptional regulator [Scandinavium hiltneri]MCS2161566.1 transcriptional regulator [Scandinavium hiltneri]
MELTPEFVRSTRESAGLTKQDAAILIGVSKRTWDSWESGFRNMPANAFKYFYFVVNGKPLELDGDDMASKINHRQIVVIFEYSNNSVEAIDSVSETNFISIETNDDGKTAVVTSLKDSGVQSHRRTEFVINDNQSTYDKLVEWKKARS